MPETHYCEVEGCERPAWRACGLCPAHLKRLQRGRPLGGPIEQLSPLERVIIAGSAWLEADAENDDQYAARLRAFEATCASWLRSKGWRPPRSSMPHNPSATV